MIRVLELCRLLIGLLLARFGLCYPTIRARDLPSQRRLSRADVAAIPIRDAKVAKIAKTMKIRMQTHLFVLFIHLR